VGGRFLGKVPVGGAIEQKRLETTSLKQTKHSFRWLQKASD